MTIECAPDAPYLNAFNFGVGSTTKGVVIMDVNVTALAADYRAGKTLEDLAEQHGISAGTVRRRLRAAGVQLRPPGRAVTGRVRVSGLVPGYGGDVRA